MIEESEHHSVESTAVAVDLVDDKKVFEAFDETEATPRSEMSQTTSLGGEIEGGYVAVPLDPPGVRFSFRTFWKYVGPGWLMSLAYLDPGNLEADLQAGASTKYELLWVLLLAHIFGLILQVLAARLGAVTGYNLAQMCRREFPRGIRIFLWIMTEIAIIGSDIQEVIGTAIALNILFKLPLWAGALITGLDTFTFLFLHKFGTRYMEACISSMILVMATCFFIGFFEVKPDPVQVLSGLVPHVSAYAVSPMVSMIGAVIMPHNIYLHSALVQSRKIDRSSNEHVKQATKYLTVDSTIALICSFIINFTLVCTFAVFFREQCTSEENLGWNYNTKQCEDISLTSAAKFLDVFSIFYGANRSVLRDIFAIGVLAAGQASTLTGTFAGQYVMEGFMQWNLPIWQRTLITRSISLVPAVAFALLQSHYYGAEQSASQKIFDNIGQWLNILQSIQLPFALLPVLKFTSSKRLMQEHATNLFWKCVCWGLGFLVIGINIFIIRGQVHDSVGDGSGEIGWTAYGFFVVFYLYFQYIIMKSEIHDFLRAIKNQLRRLFRRSNSAAMVENEKMESMQSENVEKALE